MLAGLDPLVILYMPCYSTQDDEVNIMNSQQRAKHDEKHDMVMQMGDWKEKGWRLNHFPGQPVPMLENPFSEEKFPNLQSKPPLVQLEAISSCPITCYLGEETDPHFSTASFQDKQSQLPQPLLRRLLLQTLHQLCCPSLDTLHHLNVPLVVGGPKLNTVFEAAFQPLFPKPVALHGIAVAQVQDLALGLVKPHAIDLGPSIQPVQVPLQSLPTLKQINTPAQLGVICKLTEGALDPFVQIIDKDIKQDWPQHRALGNTACDRPPTGVNSIHHHSLGSAIQPVLYPAKSTPIQAMSSQFLQENAVGDRDKQPQFPQPLFIRLVLQTLHQLRCPSLHTLQHLNVPLVVGGPKLNTVFEAAFQPLFPKPVALHGVAVAQVQDLALGLLKPHTIDLSPLIQPVQVPLQSLPPLKQINTPTQLGVLCKLTEGALDPFVQIIDKDTKQDWPQHRALGNTTCDRLPTGVNSIHHHSLGLAIQPVLYPAKGTPVQAMSGQFLQENAVGNRVKGFTEV
ncbi:hypothetical protein QYF61_008312 [Mycteria americana]|uniref:Uncharacterized protein n=1 Tax=Mycteria americana TaxID=33587 RepID=A0AAN7PI87_MYCAM|nr:hypothetical protein QYF61_008312 [Mycteria americana]